MDTVSWLDPITSRVFVTTRWNVIAACNHTDEARSQEALAELCQAYWQPVYVCIRHHGHCSHDAQDLTQDFFLRLLQGRWLEHLDEAKGRFRAYLSVALKNFLRDRWRRRWTLRRSRRSIVIPFATEEAENRYALVPATQTTPESLYERQWAGAVIEQAFDQLRIELRADGKEGLLEHFDAILTAHTYDFPYKAMAEGFGVKVGTLHGMLYRWRQRFHTLLREEIARTVVSKADIEDELQHLQRIFGHGD